MAKKTNITKSRKTRREEREELLRIMRDPATQAKLQEYKIKREESTKRTEEAKKKKEINTRKNRFANKLLRAGFSQAQIEVLSELFEGKADKNHDHHMTWAT